MDEAAPQAAEGMSPEGTAKALDVLRLLWGEEYLFGWDAEHRWWVIRDGNIGSILTAGSPEELGGKLADEAGTRPS